MKKFFMTALAAMSLVMTSCQDSVEAKAIDFVDKAVEAQKNSEFDKLLEIALEAEKWEQSLSDEDRAKAHAASEEYVKTLNLE